MALSREQSLIWEAMDIGPQWILRDADDPLLERAPAHGNKSAAGVSRPSASARSSAPSVRPRTHSAPSAYPSLKPVRPQPPAAAQPVAAPKRGQTVKTDPALLAQVPGADWESLRELIARCSACPMASTRLQTVPADGGPGCPIVIVGEAPGRDEDIEGKPFVGKSGQLLTTILNYLGLTRGEKVAIVNVLKCRPPANRDPAPEEAAACHAFLMRQLELLAPKVLILMGRHAVAALLPEQTRGISSLRGKTYSVTIAGQTVPTVVTYHPSYLLRNPVDKEKSWHDLLQAKKIYEKIQA